MNTSSISASATPLINAPVRKTQAGTVQYQATKPVAQPSVTSAASSNGERGGSTGRISIKA